MNSHVTVVVICNIVITVITTNIRYISLFILDNDVCICIICYLCNRNSISLYFSTVTKSIQDFDPTFLCLYQSTVSCLKLNKGDNET